MNDTDKGMPVTGRDPKNREMFPFSIFDERTARLNHGWQSLERLAARGGLSWCEAAAIVERRPWFAMRQCDAEAIVRKAAQATAPTSEESSHE